MKLKNKKTGEIGELQITEKHCAVAVGNGTASCGIEIYSSLAELNEEWCDYEEPKEYWFIDEFGLVQKEIEYYYEENKEAVHDKRITVGNYFDSREEAEKAVEKLKAFKRLRDKGFRITLQGCKGNAWLQANWGNLQGDYSDVLLLFGGEE